MLATFRRPFALAALAGTALAASTFAADSRLKELPVALPSVTPLNAVYSSTGTPSPLGTDGSCQQVVTYAGGSFTGGTYTLQGGLVDQEMWAQTYTVPANQWPIKIDLLETILGTQNATVQTITQWSVLVYQGSPNTGTLVYAAASDDKILPHARVGPGTAGVNINFSIDPNDPEQWIVQNNGTNQFTVAWRIDRHNAPSSNGCLVPPSSTLNAFPATDNTSIGCGTPYTQLNNPLQNWLFGINCGPSGCPANGGWSTLGNLAPDTNIAGFCITGCRPRGDWYIRATYSAVNCAPTPGACCLPGFNCTQLTQAECSTQGGNFLGAGAPCTNCPQPQGACCLPNGSCFQLTSADCATAGGTYQGNGIACGAGGTCPQGACCLPSGSCITTTSANCTGLSGTFRGANTSCATANCPQPLGACCFSTGGCLQFTSANCSSAGGSFLGVGVACSPTNPCSAPSCYANCDGSTTVILSPADFTCFLTKYRSGDAYADCDASTALSPADFTCYLSKYRTGCP